MNDLVDVRFGRRSGLYLGRAERYTGRRLKLAYLSPEIVDKIMTGMQPPEIFLDQLEKNVIVDWNIQNSELGFK